VDPARAVGYGISLADLAQIAFQENVNVPAGSMELGQGKYLMRVPGEISGPDDLRDLVVKRGETGVVYLRDVAEITEGFKDPENYARLDFEPSVSLVIKKRAGTDVVQVSDRLRGLLDEAAKRLPQELRIEITLDESLRIDDMFWQLLNSILSGLILVFLVIFVFLGFSNAFFVSLAIPFSMLITFVVMLINGMTFNMVSLFSLMVALGMLVDNGVVVVENIHRYITMGHSRVEAAKLGAAEVAWPIIGSTATTVAAYFPLIFWPGMMGSFMSLLPKTVIVCLLASLFVGLVVNPALASRWASTRVSKSEREHRESWIIRQYGRVLNSALQWRLVSVAGISVIIITIVGIWAAEAQFEFLNKVEPDRANINIEMAQGTNLEATDAVAEHIERVVSEDREFLDYISTSVGSRGASVREGMPGTSTNASSSHIGRVALVFPEQDEQKVAPSKIINSLRNAFVDVPGAEVRIGLTAMGPPPAPPVNVELSGEDFVVLGQLAAEVKRRIFDVNGLVDMHDDLERGKPEVRVIVDRQQAKLAGLSTQYIGSTVQAAVHGRKAGEYRVGDDEYDVTVKFPEWFRNDISHVQGMALVNPLGQSIPFSSVASLEYGVGPGTITRVDRRRTVTVIAEAEGRPGPEVLADVRERLADLQLPPGYALSYTGEQQNIDESAQFMVRAFVVALLLISLLLILQFNSLIQPAIIMSTVVLSLGGVFLGLEVFGLPFGFMMTGIGCISLSGIVVNNGIILVDFINVLRREGVALHEAIVTAGKLRLRPVLLTAGTTVLGLVPLAFGISIDFANMELDMGGAQAEFWKSMAVALMFGLTFATVLTLVIVPVLYSLSVTVPERLFRRGKAPLPAIATAEPIAK
jgi:multidrug efflux pump